MSRVRKPRCDNAGIRVAVASLCMVISGPAVRAQDAATPKPTVLRTKPASPNATVNLVNLLVKQGVLTEEQAAGLIKQAEEEAYVAREALKDAAAKAQNADKNATAATAAVSPPGTKRVTYVPEIVKREIREQLRDEVISQAKAERWAAPNTFPDWVSRIRFSGDLRFRYQGQFFPRGNNNVSPTFVNFNAINTGNPYDVNTSDGTINSQLLPIRDVDQNRRQYLVQARLGVEADLSDGVTAGLRIATGDSSVPISTQSMLGGGGGNFSKYPIWLDRGWLRYEPGDWLAVTVGRFDNPFFSPTDLVWYSQLGFDGIALQAKYEVAPGLAPFFVAGAFPLYDSLVNFPSNGTQGNTGNPLTPAGNLPSEDKYLFGLQAGLGWKITDDTSVQFGAAYYDFDNVRGKLSSFCDASLVTNVCDTDLLRPMFAQYGNTYMALRNAPFVNALNQPQPVYQYFGLASAFRVIDFTGRLDFATFNPVHLIADAVYVKNVAFSRDSIAQVAVNNLGPSPDAANNVAGPFVGGNVGAMGRLTVGYPEIKNLWDWNVYGAYKYLQSDAVIDAFTDPDFGLGGTNLKGYIVGARLGLWQNLWTSVKWMSATSIAGPPFAVDVLQVDLNGRF